MLFAFLLLLFLGDFSHPSPNTSTPPLNTSTPPPLNTSTPSPLHSSTPQYLHSFLYLSTPSLRFSTPLPLHSFTPSTRPTAKRLQSDPFPSPASSPRLHLSLLHPLTSLRSSTFTHPRLPSSTILSRLSYLRYPAPFFIYLPLLHQSAELVLQSLAVVALQSVTVCGILEDTDPFAWPLLGESFHQRVLGGG
jgi:hypothetical protein